LFWQKENIVFIESDGFITQTVNIHSRLKGVHYGYWEWWSTNILQYGLPKKCFLNIILLHFT